MVNGLKRRNHNAYHDDASEEAMKIRRSAMVSFVISVLFIAAFVIALGCNDDQDLSAASSDSKTGIKYSNNGIIYSNVKYKDLKESEDGYLEFYTTSLFIRGTVPDGVRLIIDGSANVVASTLTVDAGGELVINGGKSLTLTKGDLNVKDGGRLIINGSLNKITGDISIGGEAVNYGELNNLGENIVVNGVLVNNGSIIKSGGNLVINGTLTNNDTLINISDDLLVNGVMINNKTLANTSNDLSVNGIMVNNDLMLNVIGKISIAGEFINDSVFANLASFTISRDGKLTGHGLTINAGKITNNGIINTGILLNDVSEIINGFVSNESSLDTLMDLIENALLSGTAEIENNNKLSSEFIINAGEIKNNIDGSLEAVAILNLDKIYNYGEIETSVLVNGIGFDVSPVLSADGLLEYLEEQFGADEDVIRALFKFVDDADEEAQFLNYDAANLETNLIYNAGALTNYGMMGHEDGVIINSRDIDNSGQISANVLVNFETVINSNKMYIRFLINGVDLDMNDLSAPIEEMISEQNIIGMDMGSDIIACLSDSLTSILTQDAIFMNRSGAELSAEVIYNAGTFNSAGTFNDGSSTIFINAGTTSVDGRFDIYGFINFGKFDNNVQMNVKFLVNLGEFENNEQFIADILINGMDMADIDAGILMNIILEAYPSDKNVSYTLGILLDIMLPKLIESNSGIFNNDSSVSSTLLVNFGTFNNSGTIVSDAIINGLNIDLSDLPFDDVNRLLTILGIHNDRYSELAIQLLSSLSHKDGNASFINVKGSELTTKAIYNAGYFNNSGNAVSEIIVNFSIMDNGASITADVLVNGLALDRDELPDVIRSIFIELYPEIEYERLTEWMARILNELMEEDAEFNDLEGGELFLKVIYNAGHMNNDGTVDANVITNFGLLNNHGSVDADALANFMTIENYGRIDVLILFNGLDMDKEEFIDLIRVMAKTFGLTDINEYDREMVWALTALGDLLNNDATLNEHEGSELKAILRYTVKVTDDDPDRSQSNDVVSEDNDEDVRWHPILMISGAIIMMALITAIIMIVRRP